jgi:hypothetical protein
MFKVTRRNNLRTCYSSWYGHRIRDSNVIRESALGSSGQDPHHESLLDSLNEQLRLGRHMVDWCCLGDVRAK